VQRSSTPSSRSRADARAGRLSLGPSARVHEALERSADPV
jgi:hypothetical protein